MESSPVEMSEEPMIGASPSSARHTMRQDGGPKRLLVSERRAQLMVRCACELLGVDPATVVGDLRLPLSVTQFENELRTRYALTHPELVYRTDSTTERARLDRNRLPGLPRVILRQGAPPRDR